MYWIFNGYLPSPFATWLYRTSTGQALPIVVLRHGVFCYIYFASPCLTSIMMYLFSLFSPKAHSLDRPKHYLRLKFLIDNQVQFYVPKPEEELWDLVRFHFSHGLNVVVGVHWLHPVLGPEWIIWSTYLILSQVLLQMPCQSQPSLFSFGLWTSTES